MNTAVMFSSENRELETPDDLFQQLDREFVFEVDVCASEGNALCAEFLTDCLSVDWQQRVCWCNPPYGDPEFPCRAKCKKKICKKRGHCNDTYRPGVSDFVAKADLEARNGATVVCLLPHRADTQWWNKFCAHYVRREIKGRLKFMRQGAAVGTAPFPSVLVIMRPPSAKGPYEWTTVVPCNA